MLSYVNFKVLPASSAAASAAAAAANSIYNCHMMAMTWSGTLLQLVLCISISWLNSVCISRWTNHISAREWELVQCIAYATFQHLLVCTTEKCRLVLEKKWSCFMWENIFVLVLLQSCQFGGLLMSPKNGISKNQKRHIFASLAGRIFWVLRVFRQINFCKNATSSFYCKFATPTQSYV